MKKTMVDSHVSKSDSPPMTRDEFDALTSAVGIALASVQLAQARSGYADGNVGTQLAVAERADGLAGAERHALEAIIKAFSKAIERQHSEDRRNAHQRGNAYYEATSWK